MKILPPKRLLLVVPLLLGAAWLSPDVRWHVLGWVRGEALFRGRPTSFWSADLRRNPMPAYLPSLSNRIEPLTSAPRSWRRWVPLSLRGDSPPRHFELADLAAEPVLCQLAMDDDPAIRDWVDALRAMVRRRAEGVD